jgi:hypothetical protein
MNQNQSEIVLSDLDEQSDLSDQSDQGDRSDPSGLSDLSDLSDLRRPNRSPWDTVTELCLLLTGWESQNVFQ